MKIILTGAGTSVGRGLETWTGCNGLFEKYKKKGIDPYRIFDYRTVLTRRDVPYYSLFVQEVSQMRLSILKAQAENDHDDSHSLSRWIQQQEPSTDCHVSFNVDCLIPGNHIIRPHGDLEHLICMKCNENQYFTAEAAHQMLTTKSLLPHTSCGSSGSWFRPSMLLYGHDPLSRTLPDPSNAIQDQIKAFVERNDDSEALDLYIIGLSLHTKEMQKWVISILKSIHTLPYLVTWVNPSPPPASVLKHIKEECFLIWEYPQCEETDGPPIRDEDYTH